MQVSPRFLGSPCSAGPKAALCTQQRCCSGACCPPCCVWPRWGLAWGSLWPCVCCAQHTWGTGSCCPWVTEPCSSQVRCCQCAETNRTCLFSQVGRKTSCPRVSACLRGFLLSFPFLLVLFALAEMFISR